MKRQTKKKTVSTDSNAKFLVNETRKICIETVTFGQQRRLEFAFGLIDSNLASVAAILLADAI